MPRIFLMLSIVLLLSARPQVGLAEDYLLGTEDHILLRAGSWNTAERVFEPWDGISGEYVVSPSGNLSISLIGSVPAAGQTTEAVAQEISRAFQKEIGLPEAPSVSVEITAYKPIYVTGAVNAPGQYDYRYGMTVEQAVAVSGGPPRLLEQSGSSGSVAVRLQGDMDRYSQRLEELNRQLDRIDTELAAYAADTAQATVSAAPVDAKLSLDSDILQANLQKVTAQKASNKDLQEVLARQIESLDAELALRKEQIAAASAELDGVSSLKEKGLTVNARVTALSTQLNDLEAKRIQLTVARLSAEQQLNLARREEVSLVDDARVRLLAEKQEAQTEANELAILRRTAEAQYRELVAWDASQIDTATLPPPRYRVTRVADGKPTLIDLQPTDRLLPGDTLTVLVERPAALLPK